MRARRLSCALSFLGHHLLLILALNVYSLVIAGFGVGFFLLVDLLPWINSHASLEFFNVNTVTIFGAFASSLTMICGLACIIAQFGDRPMIFRSLVLIGVILFVQFGSGVLFLLLKFRWYFFKLQLATGYLFSLIMCVVCVLWLGLTMSSPLSRVRQTLLLAVQWAGFPISALIISYLILPVFDMVRADWFRLLFRLFAFPVVVELPLCLGRLTARCYPHARASMLHTGIFVLQFYISLSGRFLLANFDSQAISIAASVLLSLLEISLRLSATARDRILYRICHTKAQTDAFFCTPHARRLRADIILMDIVAENATIVLAPLSVIIFYRKRLLFQFIFEPHRAPETQSLLLSMALQLCIEFATDLFCFVLEAKPSIHARPTDHRVFPKKYALPEAKEAESAPTALTLCVPPLDTKLLSHSECSARKDASPDQSLASPLGSPDVSLVVLPTIAILRDADTDTEANTEADVTEDSGADATTKEKQVQKAAWTEFASPSPRLESDNAVAGAAASPSSASPSTPSSPSLSSRPPNEPPTPSSHRPAQHTQHKRYITIECNTTSSSSTTRSRRSSSSSSAPGEDGVHRDAKAGGRKEQELSLVIPPKATEEAPMSAWTDSPSMPRGRRARHTPTAASSPSDTPPFADPSPPPTPPPPPTPIPIPTPTPSGLGPAGQWHTRVDLVGAFRDRRHLLFLTFVLGLAFTLLPYFLMVAQFWPSIFSCPLAATHLCNCTFRLKSEFCNDTAT